VHHHFRKAAAGLLAAAAVTGVVTLGAGQAAAEGSAPSPAAVTTTAVSAAAYDDALVQAWYRTFLGRTSAQAAADSGRGYWVGQLQAGSKESDVLWRVLHSREYNTREITAMYSFYLGRGLDRGAGYWVNSTSDQGMALEWVEQNLLASDEYARRGDVAGRWYKQVLGRTASAGEKSYWDQRAARVGRLAALREIWYSAEAVDARLADNYAQVLGRAPDARGRSYWFPKQVESDVNVKTLLGATAEYRCNMTFG